MVCSFKIGANGQCCMTKFGDSEMPCGGKGESKEQSRPGYGDMAKGMMESQGV